MKTVEEHFDELPSEIALRAKRNHQNFKMPEQVEPTLPKALARGFIWADTPEGHSFWEKVITTEENRLRQWI